MDKMTPPLETEAFQRVQASPNQASTGRGEATRHEQAGVVEKLAPWHPVPTRLIDTVLPHLKDTELRVLLVVLRQTWGWKVDWGSASEKR